MQQQQQQQISIKYRRVGRIAYLSISYVMHFALAVAGDDVKSWGITKRSDFSVNGSFCIDILFMGSGCCLGWVFGGNVLGVGSGGRFRVPARPKDLHVETMRDSRKRLLMG